MKRLKGFSLVEILIVLTVISVLASMALVSYQQQKQRSQYRGMRASVHVLTDAVKSYFYTLQAYCVTANTAQTNAAYGVQLQDANFCRYRVYRTGGNTRVQVRYYRRGCNTGACTGVYTYNISGDQISCTGADCMTG